MSFNYTRNYLLITALYWTMNLVVPIPQKKWMLQCRTQIWGQVPNGNGNGVKKKKKKRLPVQYIF